VIEKQGAELLRLWVASEDYRNDVVYSRTILDRLAESYRKIRNTVRFLLGNVHDFDPSTQALPVEHLHPLDRYILGRLSRLCDRLRTAYEDYEFHTVFRSLVDFCAVDLSAFYFDILKDRLYCDAKDAPGRRSAQTVLYETLRTLTTLMAPILAFTAEEVWQHMPKRRGDPESVHIARFSIPPGSPDKTLEEEMGVLLSVREATLKALEPFRAAKNKSTDAHVWITLPVREHLIAVKYAEMLADFLVVARVDLQVGDEQRVVVKRAEGERCPRCWKRLVGSPEQLCERCASVMARSGEAA